MRLTSHPGCTHVSAYGLDSRADADAPLLGLVKQRSKDLLCLSNQPFRQLCTAEGGHGIDAGSLARGGIGGEQTSSEQDESGDENSRGIRRGIARGNLI